MRGQYAWLFGVFLFLIFIVILIVSTPYYRYKFLKEVGFSENLTPDEIKTLDVIEINSLKFNINGLVGVLNKEYVYSLNDIELSYLPQKELVYNDTNIVLRSNFLSFSEIKVPIDFNRNFRYILISIELDESDGKPILEIGKKKFDLNKYGKKFTLKIDKNSLRLYDANSINLYCAWVFAPKIFETCKIKSFTVSYIYYFNVENVLEIIPQELTGIYGKYVNITILFVPIEGNGILEVYVNDVKKTYNISNIIGRVIQISVKSLVKNKDDLKVKLKILENSYLKIGLLVYRLSTISEEPILLEWRSPLIKFTVDAYDLFLKYGLDKYRDVCITIEGTKIKNGTLLVGIKNVLSGSEIYKTFVPESKYFIKSICFNWEEHRSVIQPLVNFFIYVKSFSGLYNISEVRISFVKPSQGSYG